MPEVPREKPGLRYNADNARSPTAHKVGKGFRRANHSGTAAAAAAAAILASSRLANFFAFRASFSAAFLASATFRCSSRSLLISSERRAFPIFDFVLVNAA